MDSDEEGALAVANYWQIYQDAFENSDEDSGDDERPASDDLRRWRELGDSMFKEYFRMNRRMFEVLLLEVGNYMAGNNMLIRKSRGDNGLDTSLMMTLWVLATPESFRSVGSNLGRQRRGSVHYHYKYLIRVFCGLRDKYIRWPNPYERELIADGFEYLYGYPSVCGAIDGCHIQITAPLEQKEMYYDWHHNYSILLQGVCDHRLIFTDVYVGQPGSVGDKRTFKRSPLGRNILRHPHLTGDHHLIGDGGYTLLSKVLIPYRDNGRLTPRQRAHNYFLSRTRACIERAFGLLKNKWRRLKSFQSFCVDYAVETITASCVLHNFLLLEGDKFEDDEEVLEEGDFDDRALFEAAQDDGEVLRDHIAAFLHPD